MIAEQLNALVQQGATPEEAAELLGIDMSVAKLAADGPLDNFTDEDLDAALRGVAVIARHGEQERNRLQAGMFIIEVKKGYKAPKVDNRTQNITLVQQLISAANDSINDFSSKLRTGNGRGNPVADSEPRQIEEGAAQGTADSGSSGPELCKVEPSGPEPEFSHTNASNGGPGPANPISPATVYQKPRAII